MCSHQRSALADQRTGATATIPNPYLVISAAANQRRSRRFTDHRPSQIEGETEREARAKFTNGFPID
jgi:hypothetical protein